MYIYIHIKGWREREREREGEREGERGGEREVEIKFPDIFQNINFSLVHPIDFNVFFVVHTLSLPFLQ